MRLIHDMTLEVSSGVVKLSQHSRPGSHEVDRFFSWKKGSRHQVFLFRCNWSRKILYPFNKILKVPNGVT